MFHQRFHWTSSVAAVLLGVACAPAEPGDERVSTSFVRAERPIPGRYIVVLDDEVMDASADVMSGELSLEYGARVDRTFGHALSGFAAEMSEADAIELSRDPRVLFVEEDGVLALSATQLNPPWGLDRIDQRNLPLDGRYTYPDSAGAGVRVYVLDTGIRATHQEFAGRVLPGFDSVDNDGNPDDCNGHGTHVAGTAVGTTWGVAKAARVIGVRVLGCSGSGSTAGVIAGIDWVTANAVRPAVANMSLGGGASTALDQAVQRAIAAGIPFAVAAGNENSNACNNSPARVPEAITVGATTNTDARRSSSNFGTCLDIFAPGTSIPSAWYTSDSASSTLSGTSMASPHVAGAAALYLGVNPNATAQAVRDALVANATQGVLTAIGTGSPNLLLNISFLNAPPPSSFAYNATNTNSAQMNTVDRTIALNAGQTLTIGTCGVTGASFSGDTYLRLRNPSGTEVASNDDACGGLGSRIVYTAPSGGSYTIRAGCYSSTSCSGTVAWTIQ